MRVALSVFIALAVLGGRAQAEQTVSQIVDSAVQAIRTTSYSATMRFVSHLDGGVEREVKLFHIAPDLYRADVYANGAIEEYYIENSQELVRVRRGKKVVMPGRQFQVNDNLTSTFLRELGSQPGTVVLSGKVAGRPAYMLRRDTPSSRARKLTVGIDKETYLPLFLHVDNSRGERTVYFQMDAVRIVESAAFALELPDSLFMPPDSQSQVRAPKSASRDSAERAAPGSAAQSAGPGMPLYPTWLPEGYWVEGLSTLDCPLTDNKGSRTVACVFQAEVYGRTNRLISIFQTSAISGGFGLDDLGSAAGGYVVEERNGWLVAVFGDAPASQLRGIINGLERDDARVSDLLVQTRLRDAILEEARK